MARIIGVEIPNHKRTEFGLTHIFGIGYTLAKRIIAGTGIPEGKRIGELTDDEIGKIRAFVEANYLVEGNLRSSNGIAIKENPPPAK